MEGVFVLLFEGDFVKHPMASSGELEEIADFLFAPRIKTPAERDLLKQHYNFLVLDLESSRMGFEHFAFPYLNIFFDGTGQNRMGNVDWDRQEKKISFPSRNRQVPDSLSESKLND